MLQTTVPLELRIWDLLVKTATAIIALVGGYLAIKKFLDDRKQAQETAAENASRAIAAAKLEAVKPFNSKTQEVYFDLVKTTAIISNQYNRPGWDKAVDDFWVLFWGAVPVVADEEVSKAVDNFADTLDHPEIDGGVPMRNASMDLARACRRSLAANWETFLVEYEKSKRAGRA